MCTRVFNNQNKSFPTTARNMDWATQLPTSLFTFKSQLKKSGMKDHNSTTLIWESKYDSVVTMVGNKIVGYGSSDGINSNGLVANVLYDTKAVYKEKEESSRKLDVLRWVQYVLDICGNVSDVVELFTDTDIHLVASKVPGTGKKACLHLSVSDEGGETAIIEADNGKFNIYYESEGSKSKEIFKVMTNEPDYKTQILLNQYWRWQWEPTNNFASRTIPGGPFATDRFERASFYLNALSEPKTMEESLAQVRSIVENASVPIGFDARKLKITDHPNIAPTLWSTLSNHKDKVYYFCNARTPDVLWVDLKELNENHDVCMIEVVSEIEEGVFENKSMNGRINDELIGSSDPYCLELENVRHTALA